ncbi:MAG: hypothetical protein M1827_001286 [Pycnora praestabilis]|nr:MAG: hypothetical protein M1827_001286 [Pycnora praestabilis]
MARSKKTEEKPKDAATLQISIEDFVRTRDSVVTGLATLQSAVQDLSRAYIAHTNTVLGRAPGTTLDLLSIANPLGENAILGQRATTSGIKPEAAGGKHKKKRAPRDPNAPKRPLTPYFLYMSQARSLIAGDLGEGAKPGDVSKEGTRRWGDMTEDQKELWKQHYAKNLEAYNERVKEYKATGGVIDHSDDDAAAQLAAEHGVAAEMPEVETEDEDEAEEEEEDEEDEEEVEPEPPKAPSPPKSQAKRRKTVKDSTPSKPAPELAAPKVTPVPLPSSKKETAVPLPSSEVNDTEKEKSPEKKKAIRKPRKPKPMEEVEPEIEKEEVEAPQKEKRKGRKRKSDAVEA